MLSNSGTKAVMSSGNPATVSVTPAQPQALVMLTDCTNNGFKLSKEDSMPPTDAVIVLTALLATPSNVLNASVRSSNAPGSKVDTSILSNSDPRLTDPSSGNSMSPVKRLLMSPATAISLGICACTAASASLANCIASPPTVAPNVPMRSQADPEVRVKFFASSNMESKLSVNPGGIII